MHHFIAMSILTLELPCLAAGHQPFKKALSFVSSCRQASEVSKDHEADEFVDHINSLKLVGKCQSYLRWCSITAGSVKEE